MRARETSATFSSLGLPFEILQDIRAGGYAAPTPIQAQAIPPPPWRAGTWCAARRRARERRPPS